MRLNGQIWISTEREITMIVVSKSKRKGPSRLLTAYKSSAVYEE